ncbi:hypothetical protein AQI88_05970 [Streptomyces cellostaticus]|uniref:Uncharacterized protein n=1 Tax=Streptomyces cellostaticus TaxID=67285 RepID=A0A101NQZ8_9ACTN|nr:hypothetical protein [Streptomyces cellostaticus]KUM97768.1 hypothetical protein AQI88_05970 [Streptomyces cellostaticus]
MPETAGEPSEPAGEEIPGGAADEDQLPEPAGAEPIQPTAIIPGGGNGLLSPREALPERPPTDNDVRIFFLYAVLGSDEGQKRAVRLARGLAAIALAVGTATTLVTLAVHALVHTFAPGSTPSMGTLGWSVGGFTGVAGLFWGRQRIRTWLRNRRQSSATPPPGTDEEGGGQQP